MTQEKCPESYCPACGDKHIHQGARRINESGSPFGQWVHDELPRTFTAGDVDMYVRRFYRKQDKEVVLLRWIEHKRPGQKFEKAQKMALVDFAAIIEHAIRCAHSPLQLDAGSGVYIVRSGFEDGQPVHVFVERVSADGNFVPSREIDAKTLGDWLKKGKDEGTA